MFDRRRNALMPDAWLTEEHRFDMPGEGADIRLGVHATDNTDAALAYAVHKASQEGELPDGEPNCGIVLTLDMEGLEPLPEADAPIAAEDEDVVISELETALMVQDNHNIFSGDMAGLQEAVLDFIENARDTDPHDRPYPTSWFEEFWNEHVFESGPWVVLDVLERLAEDDPQDLLRVLRQAFRTRSFPLELFAEGLGQYRYMDEVGFDRLLRVEAVHPVEDELTYDEDDAGEGPLISDAYYIEAPPTELLWDSGRLSPAELVARGKPVAIQYHGTDVSRARSAFPELGDVIRCPWEFGQPEGVGPA